MNKFLLFFSSLDFVKILHFFLFFLNALNILIIAIKRTLIITTQNTFIYQLIQKVNGCINGISLGNIFRNFSCEKKKITTTVFNFIKLKVNGCLNSLVVSKYNCFRNCFIPLFSVSKNNFIFLRLKNLFSNPKWTENKKCFQNSICEGN